MDKKFDQILSKVLTTLSDQLRLHGALDETQKRNLIRDIGQTLNPTWPFANQGEKFFATFLDENKYPFVYADQDLETYSSTFYHEVTRPDFQIFIPEISATFWVDTKYKTLYKTGSDKYKKIAHIIPTNLHLSFTSGDLVGAIPSAIILPVSEYFPLDRSDFERLLNFHKLTNSQVWICFIDKLENPPIGYFVNVEKIWRISFKENNDAIKGRDDLRYYEAIDPVEIPVSFGIPTKINLISGTSLAPLFEPSETELEMHRDRIHKKGIWSR